MGTSLTIGHLPDPAMIPFVERYLADVLRSEAAEGQTQSVLSKLPAKDGYAANARAIVGEWNSGPEGLADIDTMNEASLGAFLDHTARLEGLPSANEAIEKSKWTHLPYWLQSVWLPIGGAGAKPVVVNIDGMPTFIGTAGDLIANLTEIAKVSDVQFGVMPQYFDLMLSNPKAFYAMKLDTFDEPTMLKWIWLACMMGAELSLKHNRPLWSGG